MSAPSFNMANEYNENRSVAGQQGVLNPPDRASIPPPAPAVRTYRFTEADVAESILPVRARHVVPDAVLAAHAVIAAYNASTTGDLATVAQQVIVPPEHSRANTPTLTTAVVAQENNNSNDPNRNENANEYEPLQIVYNHADRGIPFPLPDYDEENTELDWRWEPPQDSAIVKMSDYTLAMNNGIELVWPIATIVMGMCAIHAFDHWRKHHRKKFKKFEENSPRMHRDVEQFRVLPYITLVPVMLALMIDKWEKVYKEKKIAAAWLRQWGNSILTSVQMNAYSFFRGGLPTHNNHTEGVNHGDKISFNYKKSYCSSFTHYLARELRFRSMNQHCFSRLLHKKVHNRKFYDEAYKIQVQHKKNVATFLGCITEMDDSAFPPGSFIIPENESIDGFISQGIADYKERFPNAAGLKSFRNGKWHFNVVNNYIKKKRIAQEFKLLFKNPKHPTFQHDTYDTMFERSQEFRLMVPLVATKRSEEIALERFLNNLKNMELRPITIDELLAKGDKGLVACTCPNYLRFTWCIHSFCFAMNRGIVKGYNPLMNPVPTTGSNGRGRKRNAVRGGALTRER